MENEERDWAVMEEILNSNNNVNKESTEGRKKNIQELEGAGKKIVELRSDLQNDHDLEQPGAKRPKMMLTKSKQKEKIGFKKEMQEWELLKFELEKQEIQQRLEQEKWEMEQMLEQQLTKEQNEKDDLRQKLAKERHEKDELCQKLHEELSCPVCFSIPRSGKIPMCRNGHIFCDKCISKENWNKTCPTCRVDLDINNIQHSSLAASIIELLEIPCMNQNQGCSVSLRGVNLLKEHENTCKYTENLPCPGYNCKSKVSGMSILEHWKTCPGFYREEYGLHSSLVIEHPRSFEVIRTKVFKFDKIDELFFLVGVKIGERIVFLVKYCGGETRYSVELKLSGVEKSITYQLDAVPLSTDPGSALREGNALEVHPSIFQKIIRKPEGGFKLEVGIKLK